MVGRLVRSRGLLGADRRIILAVVLEIVLLQTVAFCPMTVQAADTGAVCYWIDAGEEENYIELTQTGSEYEVCEGDCLWSIAKQIWGDGSLYGNLVTCNKESVREADLIYPGMKLETERKAYIRRPGNGRDNSFWGFRGYQFATPARSTVGVGKFGEYGSNFCMSGDGVIACLVQDRRKETERTVSDWPACMEQIKTHVQENYKGAVSGLSFEHYRTQKEEEIYLYAYEYKIDLTEYGYDGVLSANVCVGMKLTQHLQAQFIGFRVDDKMDDVVRYVTASVEEMEIEDWDFSVEDSNMDIWPWAEWELEGMYNAFAWVEGCLRHMVKEVLDTEKEEEETITSRYPKEYTAY